MNQLLTVEVTFAVDVSVRTATYDTLVDLSVDVEVEILRYEEQKAVAVF
jgi:hypothetical protein